MNTALEAFRSVPSRQVSAHGELLVKQLEGKAGSRGAAMLKAYKDSGGVWTIGWGHTAGVTEGMVITLAQAEQLLHDDLRASELAVIKWIIVPLNDNQFDTLVIFVLNVGEEQFRSSTLVKILNKGDYAGVPAQLARWNKDNGVVVEGLINRRAFEAALWVTPMTAPVVLPPTTVQVDPTTSISVPSTFAPVKLAEITVPTPPATSAAKTKTGATTIGALLTGGGGTIIAGVTQGQTYIQAFRAALGGWADDKAWWKALTVVLVAGSIAFSIWTYLHKQASMEKP